MNNRVPKVLVVALLIAPSPSLSGPESAAQESRPPELRRVALRDDVELHYIERGKGVAVIFVHGSLGDYSTWDAQLGPFAETYRAIAYSRRYNYPNKIGRAHV